MGHELARRCGWNNNGDPMTQEKPTPTEAEMVRHAKGERLAFHEPDGSPEQSTGWQQPVMTPALAKKAAEAAPKVEEEKAMTAEQSKTYKTRRTKSDEE